MSPKTNKRASCSEMEESSKERLWTKVIEWMERGEGCARGK